MTEPTYRKKLIEVALPLDAINAESAREKSIRHGHPSTLHLWWARRPLAACRAVLFAQLVDDPSSLPEQFPTEVEQDAERQRLFGIIEELVKWENTTNEEVLEAAQAEIRRCFDGDPPSILDPFAGGGSIPLEAQRLGLEAHASDLNPVAVLINKALIEIPPKFAGQPPVHPDAENRTRWSGAEGLAEDVRRYGQWMRDEAERRIGRLYPKAELPDGSKANVIAWIWARTVICPNPACGATMPLVRSLWLGKKKGKEAWVRPVVEGRTVRFEIDHDPSGPTVDGTVDRSGAYCIVCDEPVKFDHIRSEAKSGRMGQQLMAVAAEGHKRREYLAPTALHEQRARVLAPTDAPSSKLPEKALGFRVQAYGMTGHADLFTNRQLVALTTFSDLVGEARSKVESDVRAAGGTPEKAADYANAVATYLAFALSRLSDYACSITTWASNPQMEILRNAFARQAIPMTWDFAEGNVFGGSSGTYEIFVGWISKVLDRLRSSEAGKVSQANARAMQGEFAISTDPPYYDNIGYADLSDFFFVWLRRALRDVYPALTATMVTPKEDELIATPYRHEGSKEAAADFFERGFVETFASASKAQVPSAPMTLFYAFKQAEANEHGISSTGWSTMLEGLIASGWSVTATWPVRTERAGRMVSIGTNALASSVVLACRPRENSARKVDRQGFVRALRSGLTSPIHELQKAGIAPVDLRQAAIGPGMEILSRFESVVEADGSSMRVHAALGLINEALEGVLGESTESFDAETRWAIQWFADAFETDGTYGRAEQLAVPMNVAISSMVESGILDSGGGKVRLLSRNELPADWDPDADDRIPVWEATQHLIRRLEMDGEAAAGALLRRLERKGLGEPCKALAYRLFDICESAKPELAGPYNMLAASWPEIQRIARAPYQPIEIVEQGQLLGDD